MGKALWTALAVAVGLLLALMATIAGASGFALVERDAAGLGRAYAGSAAVTDSSGVGTNPAALPVGTEVSGSLHLVAPDIQPYGAGETAIIPALYGVRDGIGIGVYAPFGLATEYPADWPGRYQALRSEIKAVRLQVAASRRVSDTLTLGAGLFLQHLGARLTNAVPLGESDGLADIEAGDTGVGLSLGALWRPDPGLTIGAAYNSHVDHRLQGDAALPFGTVGAAADLTTPEAIAIGVILKASPATSVLAGATWTRWSRLQDFTIKLDNGMTINEEHRWRDTWRLDLGAEHYRGPLTFRVGVAWDQSPIRDDAHRTPRLPDSDRVWLALGIGHEFAGGWSADLGYAYLFHDDARSEHPPVDYQTSTDILGVRVSRRW